MNVLLLDDEHCFVAFALRLMKAGHHVKTCMTYKDSQRVKTGDGLIEKIEREAWEPQAKWADLILLSDNEKWLRPLDALKRKGYPVFAPSFDSAQLELDRESGQRFLEQHGIKTMPYESFTDIGKAQEYVEKIRERLVCKPNNNQARELSYVSKSPKDMLFMLQRWEEQNMVKGEFMLQDFVPGVEVGVAGWLGKEGFAGYVEENFEHKKLMAGNVGPNTGETGTACKYVAKSESALYKELLAPLERDLIKMGHRGSVDVSAIVDENGDPRPLEFTMRFGWPSFNICQSLHPDPCEWMVNLLNGEDTFQPYLDHAIGVVVFQPPFPYDDFIKLCGGKVKQQTVGIPIYGLNDDNPHRWDIAPVDVMSGTAPNDELKPERLMVSTGDYLAVCTGLGTNIVEARQEAYSAIESLDIPNDPGYRIDIGRRLQADLTGLQEQGFCMDWSYA